MAKAAAPEERGEVVLPLVLGLRRFDRWHSRGMRCRLDVSSWRCPRSSLLRLGLQLAELLGEIVGEVFRLIIRAIVLQALHDQLVEFERYRPLKLEIGQVRLDRLVFVLLLEPSLAAKVSGSARLLGPGDSEVTKTGTFKAELDETITSQAHVSLQIALGFKEFSFKESGEHFFEFMVEPGGTFRTSLQVVFA